MTTWNQKQAILRVTTLAAALMGVYGVAGADPITTPYVCNTGAACSLEGKYYKVESTTGDYTWAVQAVNGSSLTMIRGQVEALGHNNRGVGAASGSTVHLHDLNVVTSADSDAGYWGNHGVQAYGMSADGTRSTVNITAGSISATGVYSNGIQAEEHGQVIASGVDITVAGEESYAFGVEAGSGGTIRMSGGSISVTGAGAAGARAYTGKDKVDEGVITLLGTDITTGAGAIGLLVGDTDGSSNPGTAGYISYADGAISAADSPAAQVRYGSILRLSNSALESSGHTLDVEGPGSVAIAGSQTSLISSGTGVDNSGLISVVHANDHGSIQITDSSVQATGERYTRGLLATNAGSIHATRTDISTVGVNSHAVQAYGGDDTATDFVASSISLVDGSVSTGGNESWGLYAQQRGTISADGLTITTDGQKSGFGAFAWDRGALHITGGSITTKGEDSFEHDTLHVDVGNFGVLIKNNSTATIHGTVINTHGEDAEGLRAENDGADGNIHGTSSSITATNVTVNTIGEDAHGVTAYGSALQDGKLTQGSVVDFSGGSINTSGEGAAGALARNGGVVKLTGTNIHTTGYQAHGVGASTPTYADPTVNAYASSGALLDNVHIHTSGAEAFGLVAFNGDSQIEMSDGSITTSGVGGAGVLLGNGADITLNRVTVQTNGPSIFSYFGTDEDVPHVAGELEQTLEVRDSVLETNNGVLMRVERTQGAPDGEVTLELLGATRAIGNIENYADNGQLDSRENRQKYTHVYVAPTASWLGIMVDASTKIAKSGETVTGNQGDVTAADNADVSFQDVPRIDGSVATTPGSRFSFSGAPTTITGSVMGMNNSSTNFNNDVSIGGRVQGAGGSFTFNGNANIAGQVHGTSSHFQFSTSGNSTTMGSLGLDEGSSIGGGTAANPIQIQGNANVAGGSTLGGNVNIAGHLGMTNSTLSPGNSIGTVTVDSIGALGGNTVHVEVDAEGQADLLVVRNGNVELDGANLTVDQFGGYRLDHDYTIIRTEAGTVVGQFASEELGGTFAGTLVQLDPAKYGEKDVKISLSAGQNAIDRTGYSSNQSATLDGVLSVAGRNASADAVMFMQPDARKDALNQLSGELHGSTQAALLQNSSLVSHTLTQRMRGNLGAGLLPGAPTAQMGGSVGGAMPSSAAYPLWAQVVGNWSTLDDDGNAAKAKTNIAGIFIGGDTDVGAGWRMGGALGYTDGRIKVDDRNSKSDVSSFTAALYGGNSWDQGDGKVNFLAGAAYTRHDIDSRRQVNVGGNQTLKADYRANTTQLFTELGYAVPMGERSVLEPYVGLAWLNQKAKGFTEEGGPAALQGDSQKDSVTTFTLGLRGKTAIDVGSNQAHIFAGLGWRHASGDVDPGRQVSFVQGGGATFGVAGAPIAKNAAIVDLGIQMSTGRNTVMGLGYSGQYGSDNTGHSGQLFLRTRF